MNRFPLLIAALATLAGPALADGPNRLSVLLGSRHLDATEDFQEVNPGMFADRVRPDGTSLSVGIYRNSYNRASIAGTAGVRLLNHGDTRLDMFAGLAHYPGDGRKSRFSVGDVIPLVGLRLQHRSAFVLAMPGDGQATNAVIGFGFSVDLDR